MPCQLCQFSKFMLFSRLLIALAHHAVEVRDLNCKFDQPNSSEVLFTFPTVDQVCYMLHCVTGN